MMSMQTTNTNIASARHDDPLASFWLGEDNADPIGDAAKKVFVDRYASLHIARAIQQKMRVGESRKDLGPQEVRPS